MLIEGEAGKIYGYGRRQKKSRGEREGAWGNIRTSGKSQGKCRRGAKEKYLRLWGSSWAKSGDREPGGILGHVAGDCKNPGEWGRGQVIKERK